MNITNSTGDDAVLTELGKRLARYRLNMNLSQAELGRRAGVSRNTVVRMENGESTQATNLIRTLRALGLLQNLDAVVPQSQVSPLQMAMRHGRARVRASGTARVSGKAKLSARGNKKPWEWGDDA